MQDHDKAGIAGGTLLTVLVNLQSSDIVKTCILAAVGALVSFCMSLAMKWLVKKIKRKDRSL